MMFWGLAVPETGRLDSLPYEPKASLRYGCPPLPITPRTEARIALRRGIRLITAVHHSVRSLRRP